VGQCLWYREDRRTTHQWKMEYVLGNMVSMRLTLTAALLVQNGLEKFRTVNISPSGGRIVMDLALHH
jgi:hypothetical protein